MPHPYAVLHAGTEDWPDGALLLDRERIPERVVHAKGGSAHGVFTYTRPNPELSRAKLFSEAGKKTPITARFSTIDVGPQEFPLHELGQLELNRNVPNNFTEIEQNAFNPSHLVPGLESSADPLLQSRLFSYPETHRHCIGPNYQQLPVNIPSAIKHTSGMYNFQCDGASTFLNQGARPIHLSSLDPPHFIAPDYEPYRVAEAQDGHATLFLSGVSPQDFVQPRELYCRIFNDTQSEMFLKDASRHMSTSTSKDVLARPISVFHQVGVPLTAQIAKNVSVQSYEKDLAKMRFMGSHNHSAGLSTQQMIAELYPQKYYSNGKGAPPSNSKFDKGYAKSNGKPKFTPNDSVAGEYNPRRKHQEPTSPLAKVKQTLS
ncbi:heme-dependent catalase [Tilletiaria anomala UBC 951]|uniref:Heme-dependent catalase n=1 Tax=Tilletiaria anomala (strain ATCC 24038 / CBS 436.72 / UBC 951) TaxID=1037660 RepID=A0A066VZW5_TILAU|nr:heme-dependent catalase [Tilletiaria anomala UBC 951]KDN44090.1 heme-dependent catalase [Tilletiaria anomala UBC 951]